MKRLLRPYLVLCILLGSIQALWAFPNGGNVSALLNTPGDLFFQYGATNVTSAVTARVATLRAQAITVNVGVVVPGQAGVIVSYTVTNTDTVARSFTAGLMFFNGNMGSTRIAPGYTYVSANVVGLAPGATTPINIPITIGAGVVPTSPVYIDANVNESGSLFKDFYYGNTTTNAAAQPPAQFTATATPSITSVLVAPNPARAGIVRVTVNFNMAMNMAVPPSVNFDTAPAPVNFYPFVGVFTSATQWVGTYTIPAGQSVLYDGVATVRVFGAQNTLAVAMTASNNAATFTIDTIRPTINRLIHAASTQPGAIMPVTIVASERIATPSSMTLAVVLNSGAISNVPLVFVSNVGRITFNANVTLPLLATTNRIATFNFVAPTSYADLAGNTSNVIVSGTTVNVLIALPFFSQLAFDSVVALNGDIISATPVITARYVNINNSVPIFVTSSIRVTVDGVVRFITPNSVTQVGVNSYDLNFIITTPLGVATHLIEVGLRDGGTIQAIPITRSVVVAAQQLAVAGTAANIPNPFSPNGDGLNDTTEIIYNLTQSADITLMLYSIDGVMVYRQNITAGQNGARAGYNNVSWNGLSGFFSGSSNVALPNGVYICHIIGRVNGQTTSLGRVKIVILK